MLHGGDGKQSCRDTRLRCAIGSMGRLGRYAALPSSVPPLYWRDPPVTALRPAPLFGGTASNVSQMRWVDPKENPWGGSLRGSRITGGQMHLGKCRRKRIFGTINERLRGTSRTISRVRHFPQTTVRVERSAASVCHHARRRAPGHVRGPAAVSKADVRAGQQHRACGGSVRAQCAEAFQRSAPR